MNRIEVIVVFIVLLGGGFFVDCTPVNFKRQDGAKNWLNGYSSDKLISFMQKYGYLEAPNNLQEGLQVQFLYSESSIKSGIKNIQKFGGLQQTGVLDEKTIKLMSSPRCGSKDVESHQRRRKRYIIGAQNWKKRQITYFIANWSPKVGQNETYKAIETSFDAWSLYSRLVFKRIFDNSADIIIAFGTSYHGDRYPFDGPGNILAHAFYPYEENNFGGDVHFDDDENWKNGAQSAIDGFDFQSVAVHEIGHSLGLAHSYVNSAIMYPYYKGLTPAQLDYDDILGMYQLYISRQLEDNTDGSSNENQTKSPITESPNEDEEESREEVENESKERFESSTLGIEEKEVSFEDFSEEPPIIPDICQGYFDSTGLLNNFLYIIKDNFVWQFDKNFILTQNFPKKLKEVFPNLPKRFSKIDSFYQTQEDGEIVIFSGNEYITYDPRGPIYMAYNLTRYTYDKDIQKIDAAFVWAKNSKTYLFSNDRYWRYSETRNMDFFYPRIIKRWRGIPSNINGAVSFKNGSTVFFKNDEYLLYDDVNVKPLDGYPKKIRELLSNC